VRECQAAKEHTVFTDSAEACLQVKMQGTGRVSCRVQAGSPACDRQNSLLILDAAYRIALHHAEMLCAILCVLTHSASPYGTKTQQPPS
jgi:hypothetical protein